MQLSDTGLASLLKEMLRQVNASFPTQTQIYSAAFNESAKAGRPLPCCYCFCLEKDGTLEHLPWKGTFGAVICGRCKSRFAYMDPERRIAPNERE